MAKHLMVVLTNAVPGEEEAFNDWYTNQHVFDTLEKIEGFASARRYELSDTPGAQDCPYRYLAIYEIEGDQLELAYDQIQLQRKQRAEALEEGREPLITVSPALDSDMISVFFTAMTDRLEPRGTA